MKTPGAQAYRQLGAEHRLSESVRPWFTLLLLLFNACACVATHAAESVQPRKLAEYRHVAWTAVEGAPTNVTALAPGTGGGLWLVAPTTGVYRFDGVNFEAIPTKITGIHKIVSDQAGGIWAINVTSVVHVDKDGATTSFADVKGWPTAIQDLLVVDSHTMWIATGSSLTLIRDGQPQPLDESWNLPVDARQLLLDQDGRVWASNGKRHQFAYLDKGGTRFISFTQESLFNDDWCAGPDGWVWLSSDNGIQRIRLKADRSVESEWISHQPHGPMLFDRNGGFWAMATDSLQHARLAAELNQANAQATLESDALSPRGGLSADVVWTLTEDAEGNVWAGSSAGIDRFTPSPFHPLKLQARSLTPAIADAGRGRTWIAHYDQKLTRTNGTGIEPMLDVGPGIATLAIDKHQRTWAGDEDGHLWSVDEGDRIRKVPIAEAERQQIHTLNFDCDGSLWGSLGGDWHLAKLQDDHWIDQGGKNGLPNPLLVRTFRCDAQGSMWFIYKSRVFRNDPSGFNEIPRASVKAAIILYQRPGGGRMWVAGNGVAYFDGTAFHDLKLANGKALAAVTGVVETRDGDLWVHGNGEAIHVLPSELKRAYANPTAAVGFERFGPTEGLSGSTSWGGPLPTVLEGDDGRVWFATTAGLAWVDPATLRDSSSTPIVQVRSPVVDDVVYSGTSDPKIPPLSKQFRFSYSASGVANPERLRFQYMLDGNDRKWEEAGLRRTAYYNDLPPGVYRFRVATVNDDGSRGSLEAALPFQVLPAWYQTTAIHALAVVMALGVLWLLYLYRLHYLVGRVEMREEAQRHERDRLSREIHDTLLQAVYGLVLRFQSVRDVTADEQTRDAMDAALKRADSVIAEGRDRVGDLRQRESGSRLSDVLRDACKNLGVCDNTPFHVALIGTERTVDAIVQREITRIFEQAATNAYQHAKATGINLTISFEEDHLQVLLIDDGVGIPPEIVAHGRERHWGLKSMMERADLIGATLAIDSPPAGGTSVELRLPAARAYPRPKMLGSRLSEWLHPARRLTSGGEPQ